MTYRSTLSYIICRFYTVIRCVAAEWKGITPAATQDQYIGLEDGYV
jgi:hypothetical protein